LEDTNIGHTKKLYQRSALVFVTAVVIVVVARAAVVVDTSRLFIIHLDAHLAVAFVEEIQQAADNDIVVAGELLSAGVEVHTAFPVEQDIHGPPEEVAACFPQGHRGWLPAGKKFDESGWELLLAERAVLDEEGELEVLVAWEVLFPRRR
jgi:hypothetical protein